MRIGIRIWNVDVPDKVIDVILTYRWWVPGNDPWQVQARSQYVPAQSGDWNDSIHYNELGHAISLMNDNNEDVFVLMRLPNWPPSEFKVGDEGPAAQRAEGSRMFYASSQEIVWTIRWIG